MRIVNISLFILFFCLSSALITNLPGFSVNNNLASQQGMQAGGMINSSFNGVSNNNLVLANDDVFGFKTLWSFKTYFFRVLSSFFVYALTIVPLLVSLGVPGFFALTIQLIIYIIYVMSLIEWVLNKRVV